MKTNPYIFTEVYGCGIIAKKCLETYTQFHDQPIYVFGTHSDFKEFPQLPNVEYIEVSDDNVLRESYKQGHMGTAHIFAKVIKEYSEDFDYIIHIDSDVVFRKESMSLIQEKIDQEYDLIGPYRCYKNNLNGRKDLSHIKDVTQTYFFGFNKHKISNYDFNTLKAMAVGFHNPLNHAILDFFDPVSFDILKNGGKIAFLDYNKVGGMNADGNKKNIFPEINTHIDFGENLMHFAGVGSGRNFYKNGAGSTPSSYVEWAKGRYALYQKAIYNEETPGLNYDQKIITEIEKPYETENHI